MTEDHEVCGTCEGDGFVNGEICYNCEGSGRIGKSTPRQKDHQRAREQNQE
ncbi:hypothetical protein [Actinomadura sp. WMMA1423]|uniref:hypothetical protein n=1 Tax=Actinomadura sp. WMMA1423 TaxID=2591108 RepID=UPI00143D5E9C|nr:hypothetical protein [Actinomadura sp. WMMA1423]